MPDWQAQMIAADEEFDGAPLLRTQFSLDEGHQEVVEAVLYLSALGVCEAWINGERVSADLLTPGWSSYEWRLRYRRLDVTSLLRSTSVIGVALGNGWYRGRLGWNDNRAFYGDELAAWVQLEIRFADGHRQFVTTDDQWQAGPSGVTSNDLYDGQSIDASRLDDSWHEPDFASESWVGTHVVAFDDSRLVPYIGPTITRQDEREPVRVWTSPAGATLVDFGQNLVGWIRLRVRGERGSQITVRHAEVLEQDELGNRPLRTAQATDRYRLSGADDVFEPTLTFHGFRYAELTGWPGEIKAGDLTAVVVSSDLHRIGEFECSDPLLNQLHDNVVWGMRGNFLDVPTDCPQRDERLGWTGDIAVFAPTATYLFDSQAFLRDWLADLAVEQAHHDGIVAFVVPDVLKYEEHPKEFPAPETTAIWSDAAVWVPWALWQTYGNPAVLADQFASMAAHTRRVKSLLSPNGLWDTGFQFGDWLDPLAPPDKPFQAQADTGVVATACAYRTAQTTAAAADILLRADDRDEFTRLADSLRSAFNTHYVDNGTITSDCPTVYALAITFGLLDDEDRARAGARLAELVRANNYRVSTGFAGTPYITDALTETGHLGDAYRLLLEKGCPSWLYSVSMGATTIWERWDSMLPDGTVNEGEMTSFNHYALGAVADWMHRTVAGLAPASPGYRELTIRPQPGGGLTHARTRHVTPYGPASVSWSLDGDQLTVTAEVPEFCTGTAVIPGLGEPIRVGAGEHQWRTTFVPEPLDARADHLAGA